MNATVLDFGGRTTRLLRAPADGPAVVLVHGASGRADTFAPLIAAWSWADLYIPDLPGRGAPGEPLSSVAELAAWLHDLLAHLPPDATVVGHSLGGGVALQLALEHRALSRLVLVSSSARLRVAPALFEAAGASGPERPVDLTSAFGPADPGVLGAYAVAQRGVPTATALADWRASDTFDVRDRLTEVHIPTLVAYGTADRFTPAKHQEGLVAALSARAAVFEGAGHMLPWEAPVALAEVVRGFVQET